MYARTRQSARSLATDEDMKNAPANYATKPARGKAGYNYRMQVSTLDCTGCGNCADICPAKEKALIMKPLAEQENSRKRTGTLQRRCPEPKSRSKEYGSGKPVPKAAVRVLGRMQAAAKRRM